jgi:hypothetical protein
MMAFGSGFGEQQWWFYFWVALEVLVAPAMALMVVPATVLMVVVFSIWCFGCCCVGLVLWIF